MEGSEITGTVLQIQRMSTEDGPGLRTSVFLKGCGLRCQWCHNPESISFRREVQWVGTACLRCGLCAESCPEKSLLLDCGEVRIDRKSCTGCGECTEICPTASMELLGTRWTAGKLVDELEKDLAYFGPDGGVTLTGGEAALQRDFSLSVLRELRKRGIGTALDCSGFCRTDHLSDLLEHTDVLLFDLKEIDPALHEEYTGSSNSLILSNLKLVKEFMEGHPRLRLWIRTPVIPGKTDRAENIRGIGRIIATELKGLVERWELCAFNNLCRDKYERLGRDWIMKECGLLPRSQMEELRVEALGAGVDRSVVHGTGMLGPEGKENTVNEKCL